MNYNDGKWHGWNGGSCPVHPESEVLITGLAYNNSTRKAKNIGWDADVVAFKVLKQYKEPREFWICPYVTPIDVQTEKPSDMYAYIHVREITND